MKLYDNALAPNPRRVRIYLAEKGIEVPIVQVDLFKREQKSDTFRRKNSLGALPVLELDDGQCIAESLAICRYFEERHPLPALFGRDALERAQVEMWNRHAEFELLFPIAQTFRNTHAFWQGRIKQAPDFGAIMKEVAFDRFTWLDHELSTREYIAGDRFTVADITALCAIDFGKISNIRIDGDTQPNLKRWYDAVRARPSAKA